MAWSPPSSASHLLYAVSILSCIPFASLQALSTNAPVPPLQWLEITDLLSGSAPPGLKDASVGYDPTNQKLILFGGEANDVAQASTYLLDLSSLTWRPPSPPNAIGGTPPARSAMISGGDFAASYRQGHIIIGGKGADGTGLQDAWEFDYNNEFWSQINISPGGPGARWGASGGIDLLSSPVNDPNVSGPNNTLYVAGGVGPNGLIPSSDVWQFNVAGVLSPNLDNNVLGSWTQIFLGSTLPSKTGQASAVMPSARIVIDGGCDEANITGSNCAEQASYVLNIPTLKTFGPQGCPAPRYGPAVVPNRNLASSDFADQAFILLGLFNNTQWDDGGGLEHGEVDVLNVNTGSWSRILPAGDPGAASGTNAKLPTPRAGAAALSFGTPLIGSANTPASDTIVIGGQDINGVYLSDVWILRAYTGTITGNNQTWTGFGDGVLQTGVNASGAGVTVQYLTSCATALIPIADSSTTSGPSSSTSSHTGTPSGSSTPSPVNNIVPLHSYDTSATHKVLSPVSVALLLLSILSYRLSAPGVGVRQYPLTWFSLLITMLAYGLGVAGLALAFVSIRSTSNGSFTRRAVDPAGHLKTVHGEAALAFFAGLYGLVPILFGVIFWMKHKSKQGSKAQINLAENPQKKNTSDTDPSTLGASTEKSESNIPVRRAPTPSQSSMGGSPTPASHSGESRRRTQSWTGGRLLSGLHRSDRLDRRSSDSGLESIGNPDPPQSFEVLHRPMRLRKASGTIFSGLDTNSLPPPVPRNLSDVSWLERRRSLNAVGELDYALTEFHRRNASTPFSPGTEAASIQPLMPSPPETLHVELPSSFQCIVHILLQASILGISVVSLAELWLRAPTAAFIVALIWTFAYYVALFLFALNGRPRISILSVLIGSLRNSKASHVPVPTSSPAPSRPLSGTGLDQFSYPTDSRSPYIYHQPLCRTAASPSNDEDHVSSNHHSPPHAAEEEEGDEDEEAQQQRIEQEMARRDVSIVTVPKRRLWITNPS